MKKSKKQKKGKLEKRLYPNYLCIPALSVYGIFFMLPVLFGFFLSFTDWHIMRILEPRWNGISNFQMLLRDRHFATALQNTISFALVTTIFIVVIGIILAVLLSRPLWGQTFFRTIFFLPAVLSLIVVGLIFIAVFRLDGLFNQILDIFGVNENPIDWLGNASTALGTTKVAHIWRWSGFAMAIFIAGIQGISNEYYEAAEIDGANGIQSFRFITFPLIAPAFTVTVTINLIGSLRVFEQVFVMTNGGPGNASQVLGTYIFGTFSQGLLGRSTAMGLMLFALITVICIPITKLLRRRENHLT